MAGWQWSYNPSPVDNWVPDFKVQFDCSHSECGGYHDLLVAVLPSEKVEELKHHPCHRYLYGEGISEDAGALFGSNPFHTSWLMTHGSGAGVEPVDNRVNEPTELSDKARKLVNIETN